MNSRRTDRRSPPGEHGFTLIEVILSLFILALVLGPFLRGLVGQAQVGEDTEKLQMAAKMLQSVKEEVAAVRFRDFRTYADANQPNEAGEYKLDDMFWPHSRDEVITFQKKYRDFSVSGSYKFIKRQGREPTERSMVYFRVRVGWNQPNAGRQERSTSMILVEPKS